MLDDAEKAYATMARSTGQAPDVDDDDSSQAPPAYTPTASSDPSSQAQERSLSIADEKRPMQPRPAVHQVFSGSHEPLMTNVPGPSTASLSSVDDDNDSNQPYQESINSVQRGINSFAASFKAMTASFRPKPDPLVVPLCQAVARGDMTQAEGILRQGANINGRDEKGRTPLIAAIQSVQFSSVQALLGLGADITVRDSKKNKPPLFHAVDTGNMNLMKLLLGNGADPNEKNVYGQFFFVDAIITAAKDTTDTIDAVAIAQLFLGHGADANTTDVSGRPLIIHAIQALDKNKGKLPAGVERPQPSLALVAQLLDSGADANTKDITGQPALAMALQQENMALVKMLLGRGASAKAKDITGQPLLVHAVQKSWLEMVQLLLGSGADASARDLAGTAALVIAYNKLVEAGKLRTPDAATKRDELMRIFTLLVQYGADVKVNVDYVGTQLISVVARDGDPEMMRLLIKAGADPNQAIASGSGQKSSDGETLLLDAIEKRPLDTVKMLLDHGAKVNVADKKGRTPLVSAMVWGRWDVVRLLLGRGADINALGSVSPVTLAQAMGEEGVVDMLVGRGARRERVWTGEADEEGSEGSSIARPGIQQQQSGQRERRTLRKSPPPGY
jgi:ankyrin repeat protein